MMKQYAIIEAPADEQGEDLLGILSSQGFTGVMVTSDVRNSALNSAVATTADDGNNGLEAADSMNRRYFYYVIDYEANRIRTLLHLIGAGYATLYYGPIHEHPSVQVRLLGERPTTHTQQADDGHHRLGPNNANNEHMNPKREQPPITVVTLDSPSNHVKEETNGGVCNLPGSSRHNAIMIDDDDEDVVVPTVRYEARIVKIEVDQQDGPNTAVEANDQDNRVVDILSRVEDVDATENQGPTDGFNTQENQVVAMYSQENSMDTTTNREPTTSGNTQIPQSSTEEDESSDGLLTLPPRGGHGGRRRGSGRSRGSRGRSRGSRGRKLVERGSESQMTPLTNAEESGESEWRPKRVLGRPRGSGQPRKFGPRRAGPGRPRESVCDSQPLPTAEPAVCRECGCGRRNHLFCQKEKESNEESLPPPKKKLHLGDK